VASIRKLTISGHYENIPTLTTFIAEAAKAAGFDDDDIYRCQLAADEACTNIIDHAYKGEGKGDIEISCHVGTGVLEIHMTDQGQAFDPDSIPKPDLNHDSIDEVSPGGIGLVLIRQYMDEVRHEFANNQNKLILIKRQQQDISTIFSYDMPLSRTTDGIIILEPEERLDSSVAAKLQNTLVALINDGVHYILIDFEKVNYISSRSLNALIIAWRRLGEVGGMLAICSLAPRVWSVFDLTGFARIFEIYSSRREALINISKRINPG